MNLLEDLKMSLLNFNFVLTYIIHKMLVLLENYLNYFKDNIFECFFKEYNRIFFFFFFFFLIIFLTTYNVGNFKS